MNVERRKSLYQRSIRAARLSLDRWSQQRQTSRVLRKLRAADVVVVSYPKSGRTWLTVLISHVYHQTYGTDPSRLVGSDSYHRRHQVVPRFFLTHDQRPSSLTIGHDQPLAPVDSYADKKVLWLVRDPRDVAVSAYYHLTRRNIHKPGYEPPKMFEFVTEIALPNTLAFMERWQRNIRSIPNSAIVRYEGLHARPVAELAKVMAFIGGDFTPEMIERAVAFGSFESLRRKESESSFVSDRLRPGDPRDPDSFKVRRGKVGGYRDYFSPQQLARIEAMLADGPPHRDCTQPAARAAAVAEASD